MGVRTELVHQQVAGSIPGVGNFVSFKRLDLNVEECCLMNGSDDRTAIVWQDEGRENLHKMSLAELRSQCSSVAFALNAAGFQKGDAVAISMPMTVQSVVIYLGVVLAGCVVVSIPDSLPAHQIATRLKISDAKATFTQDVILRGAKVLPLYSRVAEACCPKVIVVPANGVYTSVTLRDCDLAYGDFLQKVGDGVPAKERCDVYQAASLPVGAFCNILFSSGTTGEPKAIPWTHATPIKAAADAWAHQDVRSGDVISWPTNLGWMMGPWLIYAALLNKATIALFNGSPLHSSFGRFVQETGVTMLGLIPSIVKGWKNTGCIDQVDWSKIRCFSSSGEPSNASDYLWLMAKGHYAPVIEYCGGTEIGGAYITGSLVQSQALASFSTPAMGCRFVILMADQYAHQDENQPAIGECALFPRILGSSSCLLNAKHYDVYFKDMPLVNGMILRRHGDEIESTAGGYYRAHGRVDDTMNLGGIKVSSVEIERTCNASHTDVVETAAIGISPADGGPEKLVIVAVLRDGFVADVEDLKLAFTAALRTKMSPFFKVNDVVLAPSLPRTPSNKVMRRIIRDQYSMRRLETASRGLLNIGS
ncbi:hypothetical protein CBR_g28576 [Chara braunii]|uniref:AMP-dependent synthetase/ligase domain-containing protein n=1 Tax=Chara braunii TaxID=69332 RepID=A0A388JWD8_CHABU|nr:hypothetical protein CBR_g28576 [Chara braunii]|eukprot:GBG62105.1 hypothetical protein CBR_g28576 [Chara braunii]